MLRNELEDYAGETAFFRDLNFAKALDLESGGMLREDYFRIPSKRNSGYRNMTYVLYCPQKEEFSIVNQYQFFSQKVKWWKGIRQPVCRWVIQIDNQPVKATGRTLLFVDPDKDYGTTCSPSFKEIYKESRNYDDDFIIKATVQVENPIKFIGKMYSELERATKYPALSLQQIFMGSEKCNYNKYMDYCLDRLLVEGRENIVRKNNVLDNDAVIKKIKLFYMDMGISLTDMDMYRRMPIGFKYEVEEPHDEATEKAEEKRIRRWVGVERAERNSKLIRDPEAISVDALAQTLKNQGFTKEQIEKMIIELKGRSLF